MAWGTLCIVSHLLILPLRGNSEVYSWTHFSNCEGGPGSGDGPRRTCHVVRCNNLLQLIRHGGPCSRWLQVRLAKLLI